MIAMTCVLAGALLLSRPWLEARKPFASLALLLGMTMGPDGLGLMPADVRVVLNPLMALGTGWMAMLAAESWSLSTLRRQQAAGRAAVMLLLAAIVGIVLAALLSLAPPPLNVSGFGQAALLLGCAALALDPDVSRQALARAVRPGPAEREAPAIASLALGSAALGSALMGGGPGRALMALGLGAGVGLLLIIVTRLAQGSAMTLTWLVAITFLGAGSAIRLGLPVCAVTFTAGVVLANDAGRRDLLFTFLREWERPALTALLVMAGAWVAIPAGPGFAMIVLLPPAAFLLARVAAWRLAPGCRLSWRRSLPLSPLALALPLAVGPLTAEAAPGITTIAVSFLLAETITLLAGRADSKGTAA